MTEVQTRQSEESLASLLARAGASDLFIEYTITYPDSTVSSMVQFWVREGLLTDDNATAGKPHSGGYFFDVLWGGDLEEALRNADDVNRANMEDLIL
ncbi:hypothetical protein [Natronorubrum bangense]|uniref:Uncharacterized protein n=2 Tax=Natronorubrum bangense TaxID=61858 RepID=L9WK56_9EURY|nr:hypothetical protein [Natronorubrum bangense]ELY49870.1 hypothetical protein C494_07665 [Natronorubrum bangense JCM 10635]QCC55489.1 hypothetical protein DV706_14040 [Natronorubrum bangense]